MKPVGSFLSIDIDFWQVLEPDELEQTLDMLILRLQRLGVPIIAVMNHQQMLPFVAASSARRLVNIDAHSDLTTKIAELHCGSWVSYVPWRREGAYWWITNNLAIDGECEHPPLFFRTHDPAWSNLSEWGQIKVSEDADILPRGVFYNVVGAGLCMSPSFCGSGHDAVFKCCLKRHQIPYRRGRRNEDSLSRHLWTDEKLPADIRRIAMKGGAPWPSTSTLLSRAGGHAMIQAPMDEAKSRKRKRKTT